MTHTIWKITDSVSSKEAHLRLWKITELVSVEETPVGMDDAPPVDYHARNALVAHCSRDTAKFIAQACNSHCELIGR